MTAGAVVSSDTAPEQDLAALPVERLEAEIVGWNAQLSAATCRWLLLVGEFDRRRAWEAWECHNCAHYLDWICGIDRRTAREHVRVARALPDLPLTRATFAAGPAEGLVRQVPEVVVHVDVSVLADDDPDGCCELDDGPALAPETARRLACDAKLLTVLESDGNPLNVGRRHRRPPSALRRALAARDGCCQFPGCGSRRYLHAHHIHHWARGGETSIDNAVLLCSKHHRAVHEGGYMCRGRAKGAEIEFLYPDGSPILLPSATTESTTTVLPIPLEPDAGTCLWSGETLDLNEAVSGLAVLDAVA